MPNALLQFQQMISDVNRLLEHHPNFEAALPGKPSNDEGPLLRSCVLLIYAAWEYYFEESLIEAAQELASNDLNMLPSETKKWVSGRPPTSKDAWNLAGEGWRSTLKGTVEVYARGIEKDPTSWGLNTVNSFAVETAHSTLFGIQVLSSISWQRMSSSKVKKKLDDLVRLRGDIAHGKWTPSPLHLAHVRDWISFADKLATNHDKLLFRWLGSLANGLAT